LSFSRTLAISAETLRPSAGIEMVPPLLVDIRRWWSRNESTTERFLCLDGWWIWEKQMDYEIINYYTNGLNELHYEPGWVHRSSQR
jgi:hypothetical protein